MKGVDGFLLSLICYRPVVDYNEKAIALYVFDPNGKVILTRDMTLDYDV